MRISEENLADELGTNRVEKQYVQKLFLFLSHSVQAVLKKKLTR